MPLSVRRIALVILFTLVVSGCIETDGDKYLTVTQPVELVALEGNLQFPDCYQVPAPIWLDLGFYRLFGPSIPVSKISFDIWLEGTSHLLFIDAVHPCVDGEAVQSNQTAHLDYGIISEYEARPIGNDDITQNPALAGLNGRCMINIAYLSHEWEMSIPLQFVYDDTDNTLNTFLLAKTPHPELNRLLFANNDQTVTLVRRHQNPATALNVCAIKP